MMDRPLGLLVSLGTLSVIEPTPVTARAPSWLKVLIAVSRQGTVQLGITAASIAWVLFALVRIYQQGSGKTIPYKPRGIIVYEILSHVLRGTTFTLFLVATSRATRQWPNAVGLGYVFLLGFFRVMTRGKSRQTILDHVNMLTLFLFCLTASAELLPLAFIGSTYRPEATALAGVTSLFCCLLVAVMSPREWIVPELGLDIPSDMKLEPAREETCSLLDAYCTYSRVDSLIRKGWKNDITMNELDSVPWHYNPETLRRKFSAVRAKHTQTGRTLVVMLWPQILLSTALGVLMSAAELISPMSLYHILEYLRNPEEAVFHPSVWLLLMFGGQLLQTLANQGFAIVTRKLVIYIKLMLTAEVYQLALNSRELTGDFLDSEKTASSTDATKSRSVTGMLENLISTDINNIISLRIFLLAITSLPAVLAAVAGLYAIVSWTSFVGLGIIILGIPLAGLFTVSAGRNQEKLKAAQDSRISLSSEYLRSVKVIKYFGWEDYVAKRINQARAVEQKYVWIINMLFIVMHQITATVPIGALLTVFALVVGVLKIPLTAETAYTTIMLLNIVRMKATWMANVAFEVPRALVSLRRFDRLFAAVTPLDTYPVGPLHIEAATFRLATSVHFHLSDITVDFSQNGLNAVTGVSGSGKSSLLLALLGETIQEGGKVTRPRDAAFASQTSWLQATSIRENVLFNSEYNAQRYNSIMTACCLNVDISEMPEGDQTNVGENGTALSGGQRARVALARALYTTSSLLLLDDIFSALDTKTTTALWNRVFCSTLLKNRTVVLVTQLGWILDEADTAITLENGRIKSVDQHLGQVRRPKAVDSGFDEQEEFVTGEHTPVEAADGLAVGNNPPTETGSKSLTVVDKEVAADGVLGVFGFLQYVLYFGSPIVVGATFAVLFVAIGSELLTNYWMSLLVDNAAEGGYSSTNFYLSVYVGLSLGSVVMFSVSYWAFVRGGWVAANRLHKDFIKAVFNVPISWFTANPVGKIVNRLSGDVASLDQGLAGQVFAAVNYLVFCLVMLGAVTTVLPAFVLPTLVLSAIGVLVGVVYNHTAALLKQVVSAAQSPILSDFSEGLAGMVVIRATSSMSKTFGDKMGQLLYAAAQANAAEIEADQWLKFRINTLASAINVSAALLAMVQRDKLSAGLAGFSLTQATEMSEMILYLVFNISEVNVQMQTFHRVREYSKLPPEEEKSGSEDRVADSYSDDAEWALTHEWPRGGSVEFRNVTISYAPGLPEVLKNVNLKFNAGERVAVVGRTGSGKSTLILSILRFTHIVSGQILYDGVDITAIPRRRLRQAVSTIPQESQLFQGTLAENLDPSGTVPDHQLQKALDICQSIAAMRPTNELRTTSDSESGETGESNTGFSDRLTLSTNVKSSGENFSHGQRQVLSLCRVLVRQSKLVLLDEATSSMDAETDMGMQHALRSWLNESDSRDRCLITIAHRLQTISDYDKVVVMGSGQVLEVGSPDELMEAKGAFYDMTKHNHD